MTREAAPVPVTARRLRTTAVAGLAALVLAACGTNLAGQASVVGDRTVSDAAVATAVGEVRAQLEAAQGTPNVPAFDEGKVTARNVERMTRHLLFETAAVEQGIVVTPAQVDDIIQGSVDGQFGGDRAKFDLAFAAQEYVPASAVVEFARDFLIRQALPAKVLPGGTEEAQGQAASAYLTKLSEQLDVRVAPRYGTWVPAQVGLGPVPDDLSFVPSTSAGATGGAPSPTPSPTSS